MISKSKVTLEELEPLLDSLEEALEGASRPAAIVALLSMAFYSMNPLMDPDIIQQAVYETSQFMCMQTGATTSELTNGIVEEGEKKMRLH